MLVEMNSQMTFLNEITSSSSKNWATEHALSGGILKMRCMGPEEGLDKFHHYPFQILLAWATCRRKGDVGILEQELA